MWMRTNGNISLVPGTGLEPASREAADFRHTASFDAGDGVNIVVRALDYAFAISAPTKQIRACRIRRPPSSLYTFRETAVRLPCSGLARRCLGTIAALSRTSGARGFTEFEGFCTGRFRPGTQLLKSAMFTNFITRAGRTRFYHRSHRIQLGPPRQSPIRRMAKCILG